MIITDEYFEKDVDRLNVPRRELYLQDVSR